ncbi:cytochrome c3 family protein [Candidatus Bipolaricaulota bacterium]
MSGLRNLGGKFGERHGWKLRKLVFWGAIVVVGAVFVIAAAFYFDHFAEGDWFCGALCHPNRPQGITHEESPHASVECGRCHIGPGLWPKVEAKILGIAELVSLIANTYERPIEAPVERLKPADVICEQCHWPEKKYPERVHLISEFAEDEANTKTQSIMSVYIGDENRAGAAGAHWHVENTVLYASTDELHQEIPWVAVEQEDGTLVEYVDDGASLSEEELAALEREEMDCLDCHNRAAHQFRNPELVLDEALADGRIDDSLPFVKRESMILLSESYASQDEGIERMGDLAEFYQTEYASSYDSIRAEVEHAVEALEEVYHTTVFPEMNLTWEVYEDNLGHGESPGCFRCHDDGHVAPEGDSIPRDCTTCHSLPSPFPVAQVTAPAPAPTVSAPTDTPGLPVSAEYMVPAITHTLDGRDDCLMCHATGSLAVPDSHEGIAVEACTTCHETESGSESAVPAITHTLDGRDDCLMCHAAGVPASHEGMLNEACTACHVAGES